MTKIIINNVYISELEYELLEFEATQSLITFSIAVVGGQSTLIHLLLVTNVLYKLHRLGDYIFWLVIELSCFDHCDKWFVEEFVVGDDLNMTRCKVLCYDI